MKIWSTHLKKKHQDGVVKMSFGAKTQEGFKFGTACYDTPYFYNALSFPLLFCHSAPKFYMLRLSSYKI